jgi:putative cell wall-binding protein
MGKVKWSPLYQRACDKVMYWQLLLKEKKGQRINARKILSLRKKLNISPTVMTSSDIEARLTAARADQKKCKKYSAELQMEYRHRLAKAKEEEDNIPAATHIKNLTRQEETRALFR